jgi:hypothetical protein
MATYDYVCKGQDDGALIGAYSTDKLAFWGGTPCVRSTLANAALGANYSAYSFSGYGFSTSAAMRSTLLLVEELRALVVLYGLAA